MKAKVTKKTKQIIPNQEAQHDNDEVYAAISIDIVQSYVEGDKIVERAVESVEVLGWVSNEHTDPDEVIYKGVNIKNILHIEKKISPIRKAFEAHRKELFDRVPGFKHHGIRLRAKDLNSIISLNH